jgi:hypothetical protein
MEESTSIQELAELAGLKGLTYEAKIRASPEFALRELSEHFDYNNAVWRTLRRVAKDLDDAGIPYMLIGAMALNQHGYERATTDVDLIMTREGLGQFRACYIGRGYQPAFQDAYKTFRDTDTQVKVEVILAGGFPGDGKPKPVSFPDPSEMVVIKNIRTVPFEKLIELKLASGMSAAHRLSDLGDVQKVIRAMNLPLDFGAKLDESVRGEYERLWHTVNDADDPYDEERYVRKHGRAPDT